jgi:hypothetical protein
MRLALSFREAYKQARTLVHLKAGLIVYGSACCVGDERGGALAETLQVELERVMQLATDREPALAAEVGPDALAAAPAVYDERMEQVIDGNVILCPWFMATDTWMALRLGPRPALPKMAPFIAVKTQARWRRNERAPQTTIELRDASRERVLGRAKLGYCARPVADKSGPTLWRFEVFQAAAADGALIAAAEGVLGVCSSSESTRARSLLESEADVKVLADAASHSAEAVRMLAARVLLWCGVETFCRSHVDREMPYNWPLRVSPDLVGKHGTFLAWRGLKMVRARPFPGGGGWLTMTLGCDDDDWKMFDSDIDSDSSDAPSPLSDCAESDEEGGEDEGDGSGSVREQLEQSALYYSERAIAARAVAAATARAAAFSSASMLLSSYEPGHEDEDSEYEPDHKHCEWCGKISRRYADEDLTEEDQITFVPDEDVCECSEEEGEEE